MNQQENVYKKIFFYYIFIKIIIKTKVNINLEKIETTNFSLIQQRRKFTRFFTGFDKKLKNNTSNGPLNKRISRVVRNWASKIFSGNDNLLNRNIKYSIFQKIWLKNFFVIAFFVNKFISKIKERTSKNKLARLNSMHFQIINDRINILDIKNYNYFNEDQKLRVLVVDLLNFKKKNWKFWKKMKNVSSGVQIFFNKKIYIKLKIEKLLSKIKIFEPFSKFKIIWDFFHLFFLLILLIYTPLLISFKLSFPFYFQFIFRWLPYIIEIFDIFVKLNSSFYSKGILIKNKNLILKKYYDNDFWFDTFSLILPLLDIITSFNTFYGLIMLRILSASNLIKNFIMNFNISDKNLQILALLKLFFIIIYVVHICGCLLNYISNILNSRGDFQTWIFVHNLVDSSWLEKY